MKFDVIIIGGGLAGHTAATALQGAGLKVAVVSAGLSLSKINWEEFRSAGGTLLQGDVVTGGSFSGDKLISIDTERLGPAALEAPQYILATGKYFSRGLVAGMDGSVIEPVFGLDVDFNPNRTAWFAPTFSAPQPFLSFGLKTQNGCALKNGLPICNLHAAGEILAGISNALSDSSDAIRQSAIEAAGLCLSGGSLPLRGLRSQSSLRPLPSPSASSLCDNLLSTGPVPLPLPGGGQASQGQLPPDKHRPAASGCYATLHESGGVGQEIFLNDKV